jgi:hypothetical protein
MDATDPGRIEVWIVLPEGKDKLDDVREALHKKGWLNVYLYESRAQAQMQVEAKLDKRVVRGFEFRSLLK